MSTSVAIAPAAPALTDGVARRGPRPRRVAATGPSHRGRLFAAMFLIHEVVGLLSGLVLVIVCLTGAILVFEDQITAALHPARAATVPVMGAPLALDSLVAVTSAREPALHVATITVYDAPARPVRLAGDDGALRFVNPYTGAVVARQHGENAFFETVTAIHRRLLAGEVGRRIVGIATLCFVVVLLSGIWIWWPKRLAQLRARLTLARGIGWKRRNYDLHVVLGIYAVVLLLAFGATGLVWSFRTVGRAVDNLSPRAARTPPPPHSAPIPGGRPAPLATVLAAAQDALGPGRSFAIYLAHRPRESVMVLGLPYDAPWRQALDYAYVDRYSARVLRVDWFRKRPLGELARRATRPIHVGSLYGLPSQIAAFLACLVATVSPITGFIIWVNRKWPRTFRRPSRA